MMKRMIIVWLLLISLVMGVGFFRSDWSVLANNWTLAILILLVLLLSIEIGLYYWRRKMLDLSRYIKNREIRGSSPEQEDHYIPPSQSS